MSTGGTLWVESRQRTADELRKIIDHLHEHVPPDWLRDAGVDRYVEDSPDGRDLRVFRSGENTAGQESKFAQIEMALSAHCNALLAHATVLQKAVHDNVIARRAHAGEPNLVHTDMALSRGHDTAIKTLKGQLEELTISSAYVPLEQEAAPSTPAVQPGPHSTWLEPLAALNEDMPMCLHYYCQHGGGNDDVRRRVQDEVAPSLPTRASLMPNPTNCPRPRAQLLKTIGTRADDADDEDYNAAVQSGIPGVVYAGDLDPDTCSWKFKRPVLDGVAQMHSDGAAKWELMPAEHRGALFASVGLVLADLDRARVQRLLAWKPKAGIQYCVYDGPCFAQHPNMTLNKDGKKRYPHKHTEACDQGIAQRLYSVRFPGHATGSRGHKK